MNNKKHKGPTNSKGHHHGYQEWYTVSPNETLWLKGICKNGLWIGYHINNTKSGAIGDEGTEIKYHIR